MLELGASQTISGYATTAATVNCAIGGLLLTLATPPVAQGYQILSSAGLQLPATSPGTLYGPGASNSALISSVMLFNTNGSTAQTVNLYWPSTAAADQQVTLQIPAGGWAQYEDGDGWKVFNNAGLPITSGVSSVTGGGFVTASPTTGGVILGNSAIGGDITIGANSSTAAVTKINGSPLGTTTGASTNAVLVWNGSDWVPEVPAGDVTVSGSFSFKVTAIQGNAVSATAPSSTLNTMMWNGSAWIPTQITGDASTTDLGVWTNVALQGHAISSTAPSLATQALVWNTGTTSWTPTAIPTSVSNSDGTLTISPTTGAVIASRPAITGDATIAATSNASVVVALQGHGISATAPTTTLNMMMWNGSNWIPTQLTGDATITDLGVMTNVALQGHAVSASVPIIGQILAYRSTGWTPSSQYGNVLDFGADPTNTSDSTLAIYNAVALTCYLDNTFTGTSIVTSTANVTTSSSFTLSVTANSIASTGTLIAQTTLGPLLFTYTGGGTTSLSCTAVSTGGVTGGVILNGSYVGPQSTTSVGGTIYFPAGRYLLSYPVIISTDGVALLGDSATADTDTGTYTQSGGSWLVGSTSTNPLTSASAFCLTPGTNGADTPLVRAVPFVNASTGTALDGFLVHNLNFDCRGNASTGTGICNGLQLISCHGFDLENIWVMDPNHWAYQFNCLKNGSLGEAHDCTRGAMRNVRFRCLEAASGGTATTTTTAATNVNALSGSSLALSAATTGWPATGYLLVQAADQTCGTIMDYLCSYTGGANTTTLTGVTCLGVFNNAPNGTAGGGAPSALMFNGAVVAYADGNHAHGQVHHGSLTANSCLHKADSIIGQYGSGRGLYLGNSDSTTWDSIVLNQNGNGIGVDFLNATSVGGLAGTARNHVFYNGSPGGNYVNIIAGSGSGGGARLRGTADFSAAGTMSPALYNHWHLQQVANGEPPVVIGTGCQAGGYAWTYNGAPTPVLPIQAAASTFNTIQTVMLSLSCPAGALHPGTTYRMTVILTFVSTGTTASIFTMNCGTGNASTDAVLATMSATPSSATSTAILEGIFTTRTISTTTGTIVGFLKATNANTAGFSTTQTLISPAAAAPGSGTGLLSNLNNSTGSLFVTLQLKTGATTENATVQMAFIEQVNA
jgi:hypothetical protein